MSSSQHHPKRTNILSKLTKLDSILLLVLGIVIGSTTTSVYHSSTSSSLKSKTIQSLPKKGIITTIEDIPVRKTSHVDEKGRPITKQQFLDPFVLPDFVGFSVATFLPGQVMMPPHEHDTLYELFYVIEGSGVFEVNGVEHEVSVGSFLMFAPHEKHGIWVPEDNNGPLKVAVTGVVIGPGESSANKH